MNLPPRASAPYAFCWRTFYDPPGRQVAVVCRGCGVSVVSRFLDTRSETTATAALLARADAAAWLAHAAVCPAPR